MIVELLSAFLALTFLEIVLGIDNIVFISILAQKFKDKKQQAKLMNYGLSIAMIGRIILLFLLLWLSNITKPLFEFDFNYFESTITIQVIVLLLGGLFLVYKATKEIYHKVEGNRTTKLHSKSSNAKHVFRNALIQIILIDVVFSFDSVLTGIGMTNGIPYQKFVMIVAIVISIIIMLVFANAINRIITKHQSLQVLALSFLLLIGFLLITESMHVAETEVFNTHVNAIPKGYLYFVIAFSLIVEFINFRIGTRNNPKE